MADLRYIISIVLLEHKAQLEEEEAAPIIGWIDYLDLSSGVVGKVPDLLLACVLECFRTSRDRGRMLITSKYMVPEAWPNLWLLLLDLDRIAVTKGDGNGLSKFAISQLHAMNYLVHCLYPLLRSRSIAIVLSEDTAKERLLCHADHKGTLCSRPPTRGSHVTFVDAGR